MIKSQNMLFAKGRVAVAVGEDIEQEVDDPPTGFRSYHGWAVLGFQASRIGQNSPAEASKKYLTMCYKILIKMVLSLMKLPPMGFSLINLPASREKAGRSAAFFVASALLAFPAALAAYGAEGSRQLPVIGPAPHFTLTSQDGKPVALADLRGKVVAVTFIYTQCPDICPMLTQKMVEIQDELGADFGAKVAFVSISLDPGHDTPEVLKDYAQFWGVKPDGWAFLTGSPEAVRDVTRRYGVFFAKKEDGSVDHTQLTSLVDAEGQMRVQYLGARFDPEEFRRDLMSLVDKE
jgi:protein SCO1/2